MKLVKVSSYSLIIVSLFTSVTLQSSQIELKVARDSRIESTHGDYTVFYPTPVIHLDGDSPPPILPPYNPQPPQRGDDDPDGPLPPGPFWNPDPNPDRSVRELIEDEYGPVNTEMSLRTKRTILEKYPILSSGGDYDILKILCLNEPTLQREIMDKLSNYSRPQMVQLFKTFEIYDDTIRIVHYKYNRKTKRERSSPAQGSLYRLASQSAVRRRASTETSEVNQHRKELSNISNLIPTLGYPAELQNSIDDLRTNIHLFVRQGPALVQELLDRDAYTSKFFPYQVAQASKVKKYRSIISGLDLKHTYAPSVTLTESPPYFASHGTLFHQEQKVAILDSVDELDTDHQSKEWPTLNALYPNIREIYKESLIGSHDGYVVSPHRLWVVAQMMSLMAKSHDKTVPLKMPFSFVDESQLSRKAKDALFRSQHLYYISTYKSLLRRLSAYRHWVDQLYQHFGEKAILTGQDRKNLYIAIKNEHNRFKEEERQLKYLKEEISKGHELEQREDKERLDLLEQSSLGMVNHQDYIKTKLTQWKAERTQQLEYLKAGTWQQEFLNDNASALLNKYQCALRPFQEIYVEDDQLVFCNEYITIVNMTADADWDTTDAMQVHIQRTIIKFAETGAWSLRADNKDVTEALTNLCRAFFEYGLAHITASQNPSPDIITVPGFIVGPVDIVGNDYGEAVCNTAYHFANVLDTVCNITITNQIDPQQLPHQIAYSHMQNLNDVLERRGKDYRREFNPDNVISMYSIETLTHHAALDYAKDALAIGIIGLALLAPYISVPGLAISAVGTVAVSAELASSLSIAVAASAAHLTKRWIALFHESNQKGAPEKIERTKTFEKARNRALEIIGNIDPHAGEPNPGRLGPFKGKITGRRWFGNKVKWHLDWDPNKGAHINVRDFRLRGAGKVAILFEGDLKKVLELLKHLNR